MQRHNMQSDVIAKICEYRTHNINTMLITFESLDPFYKVGIKHRLLETKIAPLEAERTLFIYKAKDSCVRSGWALFSVTRNDYLSIDFVQMQPTNDTTDITDKLNDIESALAHLTALVEKLVRTSDGDSDSY